MSTNSAQMRRRTLRFLMNDPFLKKHAREEERREDEAGVEFDEGGETPDPPRGIHDHEGPEFLVALGGEVQ